ncbi:hypothetical protein [Mucisphaera calidilacus]|uniref:hypothetical protein n=1 Tax=Mucisphaera calidilacus TaxID=2527982 RepID=UPI001F1EE499|nr:hypothetical protein [Mucisphaera calidilacus]
MRLLVSALVVLVLSGAGWGQDALEGAAEDEASRLAKQTQNPVADLISLPFQNNTHFGAGVSGNKTANVLNIQPVIPVSISEDWNLITRTILPVIYIPDTTAGLPELAPGGGDSEFGLGDVNFTAFFSPKNSGG